MRSDQALQVLNLLSRAQMHNDALHRQSLIQRLLECGEMNQGRNACPLLHLDAVDLRILGLIRIAKYRRVRVNTGPGLGAKLTGLTLPTCVGRIMARVRAIGRHWVMLFAGPPPIMPSFLF